MMLQYINSVRVRILLLILLSVLPMLAIALYNYYAHRSDAYRDVVRESRLVAQSFTSFQTRVIEGGEGLLEFLLKLPNLRALNPTVCGSFLNDFLSTQRRYTTFATAAIDGTIICNAVSMSGPINVADRSWFRRAVLAKEIVVSDYLIGRATGKPSLGLAAPLIDPSGRVLGVFYAGLDLQWLEQQIDMSVLPANSDFWMLDPNGNVLVHQPHPGSWVGKSLADTALFQALVGATSGTTVDATGTDQAERKYYVEKIRTTVDGPEVYLAVGFLTADIDQNFRLDLLKQIMGIGILSAFLLAIAYATSTYAIARPLDRLTALSRRISDGDYTARSGIRLNAGEFGQLAHSLDTMAAKLEINIAESRQMMASLQQAQKMEAVGQLTGGIAHDFNNLLAVIIGNLDLLMPRFQAGEDRELAEEALAGALRGAELTRQMLTFARRQTLEPTTIELPKLMEQFTTLLKRTIGESIVVETSVGDGLWPCLADPSQLQSALLNLAINARDAMPAGGALTIEAKNAHLDEHYAELNADVVPGDYVKISVTDTGTGIPADILARVMEPFFTTKEAGKGTGLGLSMVFGFAKQSGGHLKIYSESGHGTTVNLYLPRQTSASEQIAPASTEAPHTKIGGGTVLVVDDNEAVRRTAVRQLRSLGYNVIEAGDAPSALAVLKEGRSVDLLFSDVIMPGGMTGFDLAKEVLHLYPNVRILLATGFADAAVRRTNGLSDSVRLLTKPYRRDELAARLREILDPP